MFAFVSETLPAACSEARPEMRSTMCGRQVSGGSRWRRLEVFGSCSLPLHYAGSYFMHYQQFNEKHGKCCEEYEPTREGMEKTFRGLRTKSFRQYARTCDAKSIEP